MGSFLSSGDTADAGSPPAAPLVAKSERHYHTQPDPMASLGFENVKSHCQNKRDQLGGFRAVLVAVLLTTASFACFVTMLCVWFHIYHSSFLVSCGILAVLLVGSVLVELTRGPRRWLAWMGPLCSQGSLAGTVLGFFIYFQHLAYYFAYQDLRVYSNVAGSQRNGAYRDASMLLFTEDTRVDPLRTVGFSSRWTGETYCVAPIVDPSMGSDATIQYYAVGMNCCQPRSEYECDGAQDPTVRSGLVILEPEDVARPWMQWAVKSSILTRYERAIKLQAATYYTPSAQKPKLMRWTRDPEALKDAYYSDGLKLAYSIGSVYFFVCLALGVLGGRSYFLNQPGSCNWQQPAGGWQKGL